MMVCGGFTKMKFKADKLDIEKPDYFFYIDEEIYFRELRRTDLNGRWPFWFNDPQITEFTKGFYPTTRESQEKYFDSINQSETDVVLAIIDRKTNIHIGNIGLHNINFIHRTAQFGIVLGEKGMWGKGIGSKVWKLMVKYGFQILNLHKINATVMDGNEASLKCALKAGFQIEGRQLEQAYKNGKYYDLIHLGILKKDLK